MDPETQWESGSQTHMQATENRGDTQSLREKKREIFDACIERRWGDASHAPKSTPSRMNTRSSKQQDDQLFENDDFIEYEDDEENHEPVPEAIDDIIEEMKHVEMSRSNQIIGAEIKLQHGDKMQKGIVTRRVIGKDGKTEGVHHPIPVHNTCKYEVEFPDGAVKEFAANVLAENMISQVDENGYAIFDGIIDAKKDDTAVSKADRFVVTKNGCRKLKQTTKGWKILVLWKDGSEQWIPLKDVKESNPVDVAEFAKAKGIDDEPAFAWWVPHVVRKRDIIISKVKAKAKKTTHKYGIRVPRTVKEAKEIDAANDNAHWQDAIAKEMCNVGIAFNILENDEATPVGWKKTTGHMIFLVKMDFTRKARWVLDGHKCDDPEGSTCAGVVSRESVRIALTHAARNDLEVWAADIRNACLQAPSSQKDCIICGEEFGLENVGKRALMTRALHGGKAAGRDFRNHLRHCMRHLNFEACLADPDVWMRPALKADGTKYCECALLCTLTMHW